MYIETVQGVLAASPAVTALVGTRISPVISAQGTARPAITLSVDTVTPFQNIDGSEPSLYQAHVALDILGRTHESVDAIAVACRAALGAAGIQVESQVDSYESEVSEYRITQDVVVWA